MTAISPRLTGYDHPDQGTFEAIFHALDASSEALIGLTRPQLLVIPIHTEDGLVTGGFWGCTTFRWLHVQMLFVPEPLRGHGIGSALMTSAEIEAQERGCLGAHVDAFSFQAAPFYRKIDYTQFGVLHEFPPGHDRLFLYKRFGTFAETMASPTAARQLPIHAFGGS